jgi:O-antigen/teichoic acid export membrane protein
MNLTQAAQARFSSTRAYAQTFASTLVGRCFGVVSGILTARLLGPTGRGELAVIVLLPTILMQAGDLELPRSLAFEVSREGNRPQVVSSGFWLAILLGCAQSAWLALALPFYLPADKMHLLFVSRCMLTYLPAAYITSALTGIDQGRGRFGRFSLFSTLSGILYAAAILLAWGTGHVSPVAFAVGLLASIFVTAGARAALDWDVLKQYKPDWAISRKLLKRGFNYYLPAISSALLGRCDMFLLVRLLPAEAIGLYAVAQAIAVGQIGAVNPFVQVGFSAVAGHADQEQALKTLARHFRFAALAVIAVGLVAAVATPWGIRLFFGAKFIGATSATLLLIGATAFWGMAQVLDQGLRAACHPRPGIFSNLLGAACLFAVGIPASSRFGINGMAGAMLGAQLVSLLFLAGFCMFYLGLPASLIWPFGRTTISEVTSVGSQIMRRSLLWCQGG